MIAREAAERNIRVHTIHATLAFSCPAHHPCRPTTVYELFRPFARYFCTRCALSVVQHINTMHRRHAAQFAMHAVV